MSKQKKVSAKKKERDRKLSAKIERAFKEAVVAKAPLVEKWYDYLAAYDGSLFTDHHAPAYKTKHVSNFIYSSVEAIRPVIFDGNPSAECIPITEEAVEYANDVTDALHYEFERTNLREILIANSIYTYTIGTSIIFLPYVYDEYDDGDSYDGDVQPVPISPFNIYPDPLATSVEDAEYIIYAQYVHQNKLKKDYPQYAEEIKGGDIIYSELVNNRDEEAHIDNQVLILEMWCRDYTEETEIDENGEEYKVRKYPKGRVITCAPDLGIVFEDKQNPYSTGRFPFFLFKDIDLPFEFWGEGEVKTLLSPQIQANELYNQVIDNAKSTGNMQWIIDKNAGIAKGELTNRPGLIIRKNPGTDVHRESPPSMPMYVQQMIEVLKSDIEVLSGIHDVSRGQTPSGIQSAAAIVALQEAAQTRIRLKEKIFEGALGQLGTEWIERIRQFWKFNRLIPKKVDASSRLQAGQLNGIEMLLNMFPEKEMNHYEFVKVDPNVHLEHQYKVIINGTSVLQRNRASMLDTMIRLGQTMAEDGLPMVPREAVLDYLPGVNKRMVLQYYQKLKQERMAEQNKQGMNNDAVAQLQLLAQQLQQMGQQVAMLTQRAEQEDQTKRDDNLRVAGYQQGMADAAGMQAANDQIGGIPRELYDELSGLDEESVSVMLQRYPELLLDSANVI